MDRLPQELIHRIVSFVERHEGQGHLVYLHLRDLPVNLPPLSVLSQPWKEAVEAITFRELEIKSTDLLNFQSIVSGARRGKVKSIAFVPVLPGYSDADCGRHETIREQIANNESFSYSLKQMFNILKDWEDDGVSGPIDFRLRDPEDLYKRDRSRYEYESDVRWGKRSDIFEKRWEGSFIRLVELEQLPFLGRISSMSTSRVGSREFAPCTIAQIATRFPNLESIAWNMIDLDDPIPDDVDSLEDIGTPESVDELDMSGQYTSSRRERRNELAQVLSAHPFRSVRSAHIEIYHESTNDQSRENDVLIPLDSPCDPLSSALFLLSQTLTTFHLAATIDSSLFWPTIETDYAPTWPYLRTYTVTFDLTTPSGKWYFIRNPARPHTSPASDDSRTFNIFRDTPESEQIEPLLLGFGRAAQRMHVLELASLTCMVEDEDNNHSQFEVSYIAPGKPAPYGDEKDEDVKSRRIYYEVGDWRPSDDVACVLRGIGAERYRTQDAVERFLASQY